MDAAGLGGIGRRLAALEQQQRRLGTSGNNADYYRFRMAPTSPPSTSIVVTDGQGWNLGAGDMTFTPGGTFDLAVWDSTHTYSRFTTPFAYTYYWLSVYGDGSRLYVGGVASNVTDWWEEFETAVEAEQGAAQPDCFQLHNWPPWDIGPPIGCLILRNSGNVATQNSFMPIDAVNRGRSYIFRTHSSMAPRSIM